MPNRSASSRIGVSTAVARPSLWRSGWVANTRPPCGISTALAAQLGAFCVDRIAGHRMDPDAELSRCPGYLRQSRRAAAPCRGLPSSRRLWSLDAVPNTVATTRRARARRTLSGLRNVRPSPLTQIGRNSANIEYRPLAGLYASLEVRTATVDLAGLLYASMRRTYDRRCDLGASVDGWLAAVSD